MDFFDFDDDSCGCPPIADAQFMAATVGTMEDDRTGRFGQFRQTGVTGEASISATVAEDDMVE